MAELTSAGLEIQTQDEIRKSIETDQRAEISDRLDLSTSSPLGQANRIVARALAMGEEALAALYMAIDPDSATGDALLRLCALTGTIREPATKSRVSVTINVNPGTYAIGTLFAAPTGRPSDRFVNAEAVVNGGGAAANFAAVFEAVTAGPVQATASTLAIATPVAGWNSIVSHPDATVGEAEETEAALRARRNQEVEAPGSSSTSGIAADILREVPLVETCYVVENDTDAVVDSIPAHAIEVVVYGPAVPTAADDDQVAAQIQASKAAGIGTYGTTSRTILDSEGQSHAIKFTRPVTVTPTIAVTLQYLSSAYAGDSAVKAKIVERAAEVQIPGRDVDWSSVISWCHEVAGVLRVTNVTIAGVSMTNLVVTSRQVASILLANITVSASAGTP